MSELQELASQIKRSSETNKNLTDEDITRVAQKLEKINSKGGSNAAAKITKDAVDRSMSQIKSRIPDAKTIGNAFLGSNPLLQSAGNMFKSITETLGKTDSQLDTSNDVALAPPKVPESEKGLATDVVSMRELLEEAVEQLKYSNNLEENILDESRRSKLTALGEDEDALNTSPDDRLKGLDDLLENQEEQLRLQTLDFLTGTGGITTMLSGLLGSSGLFATGGKFAKGLKLFSKRGLKFLGPIGVIAGSLLELYDGFNEAEDYFGEAVSVPRKMQYAVTRLVTSIFAPIDWAIEAITGESSNIRGFFDNNMIIMQDAVIDFIKPFTEFPIKVFKFVSGMFSTMFDGIDSSTLLSDLPGIVYGNIKGMVSDGVDIISDVFSGLVDSAFNAIAEIPSKFAAIFEGLNNSLKMFFNNTIDNMANGLSENIGFGVGEKLAEKLKGLKFEDSVDKPVPKLTTTTTTTSSMTTDPTEVRNKMNEGRQKIKDIKAAARQKKETENLTVAGGSRMGEMRKKQKAMLSKYDKPTGASTTQEPTYGEQLVIKAIEGLKANQQPTQVVTSAPVTTNQQTTVLRRDMTTYSGLRQLNPEQW